MNEMHYGLGFRPQTCSLRSGVSAPDLFFTRKGGAIEMLEQVLMKKHKMPRGPLTGPLNPTTSRPNRLEWPSGNMLSGNMLEYLERAYGLE